MKASHRFVLSAAGLSAALAAAAVPSVAGAQQRQGPGPETQRVLVTAFRGDQDGGVRLAEEIRKQVTSNFSIRQVMPVSKKDIDNTLVQSGYRPDSALNPNDIRELSKLVRGDEVIDGTVAKTANGYRVNARLFLPTDAALSQPLVSAESNNLGDVARQIVREYDAARKQIGANRDCYNAIREKNFAAAAAAARKGIAQYPKATIARLCLASSFQAWKTTADSTKPWKDSVLAVTRDIVNLDKQSSLAFRLQYDALKAKGDTANAMTALMGLMGASPNDAALREQVIAELVTSGKAATAVPTAKQLMADNPGDPQAARTYWLVLRAAGNFKESVPAGQAYIALDPTAADTNYFYRQIQDLVADSAFAKAGEMAAQGAAKFPRNGSMLVLKADAERRAGQLPAAKASLERALQLDPKAQGASMLLAQISADLGQVDDAIKAVKADVATNATNKDRNAQFLLGLGSNAYKAGVASKRPEDFRKAVSLLQASDEINPSAQAKFFLAISAWQVFAPMAQNTNAMKACNNVREAASFLQLAATNMPGGGSVSPEAAKQVLDAVPQSQTYIDSRVRAVCR